MRHMNGEYLRIRTRRSCLSAGHIRIVFQTRCTHQDPSAVDKNLLDPKISTVREWHLALGTWSERMR